MCNHRCIMEPFKNCIEFLVEFYEQNYYCKLVKEPGCTTYSLGNYDLYSARNKVYPSETLNTCTHHWKHSADSTITSKCPTYTTRKTCEADTNCYFFTENYKRVGEQKGCSNFGSIAL